MVRHTHTDAKTQNHIILNLEPFLNHMKAGPGGEWKNSKGEKVKHQEVFQSIINMRKRIKTNLVHVRGHRDDYGNNEADRLAVEGAKQTP